MLEEIKKIQGICHDEFNEIIQNYIDSGIADLAAIGIARSKLSGKYPLINTAIYTYVLSFLDTNNSEMYANSYLLQKDALRHMVEYREVEDGIY